MRQLEKHKVAQGGAGGAAMHTIGLRYHHPPPRRGGGVVAQWRMAGISKWRKITVAHSVEGNEKWQDR